MMVALIKATYVQSITTDWYKYSVSVYVGHWSTHKTWLPCYDICLPSARKTEKFAAVDGPELQQEVVKDTSASQLNQHLKTDHINLTKNIKCLKSNIESIVKTFKINCICDFPWLKILRLFVRSAYNFATSTIWWTKLKTKVRETEESSEA